ncbi:MAG: dehydrogenase [Patescibacteria group bacterium]|nr:dehydrogenase [Patescibacteria group bacterium]
MQSENIYDLIIVGGGPAGASAAIYAARKKLKSVLILKEWGGQSVVSDDIQNWIGTPHISGMELSKNLQRHTEEYAGDCLSIKTGLYVKNAKTLTTDNQKIIEVTLENGEVINARALLVATGSERRKLDIPGADVYEHKGLTYCATCDGPMYSQMDVAVIGGGNAGFESAAQLLAYCKSVTLLSRSSPRADEITIQKLQQNPNFKLIINAVPKEIFGDKFVTSMTYTDTVTNEEKELLVEGVFVEVGQVPATSWVKDIVNLDENNKIKIDPWTGRASEDNLIWAAGDATNILYHQNNIASGDAVKALEDIYKTLKTK